MSTPDVNNTASSDKSAVSEAQQDSVLANVNVNNLLQQGAAVWDTLQSKISDGAKAVLNNGFSLQDNGSSAGGPEVAPQFRKEANKTSGNIVRHEYSPGCYGPDEPPRLQKEANQTSGNIVRNEHSILVKPSKPHAAGEGKDTDKAPVPNSTANGDSLNKKNDVNSVEGLKKSNESKSGEGQTKTSESKNGESVKKNGADQNSSQSEKANEAQQPSEKQKKDIDDWNKKVDAKLGNTEAGRLMKELGKALITGDKASVEQFQKMMQEIKFEPKEGLREQMHELETDLSKKLGASLSLRFGGTEGEPGQIQLESVTVSEPRRPHQFHAQITIPREGKIEATNTFTEGYAGPIVNPISVSAAASRILGDRKKQ